VTRRKLSLLLLLAAFIAAPLSAGTHSTAAFKKLQSLAGDWEGKDGHGMAVKTSFKALVSGTAVSLGRSWIDGDPMLLVVSTSRFAAALACWEPRSCPRLAILVLGPAIFAVFIVLAIASRSDLAAAQPVSRAQPDASACWTGVETAAVAKKRDDADPPIHPRPRPTASAPMIRAG